MSGLQVLNKSYTFVDHIKKIFISFLVKFIAKVTTIQEARDLNSLSLECLIRNLQSREFELNGDEPKKQVETVALKSTRGSEKSSQKLKEATRDEASGEESHDDELSFIIKRFKYLARKKNKFSGKGDNFKGPSSRSKYQDG